MTYSVLICSMVEVFSEFSSTPAKVVYMNTERALPQQREGNVLVERTCIVEIPI